MTTVSVLLICLTASLGFLALGLSVLTLDSPKTSDGKRHRRPPSRLGRG